MSVRPLMLALMTVLVAGPAPAAGRSDQMPATWAHRDDQCGGNKRAVHLLSAVEREPTSRLKTLMAEGHPGRHLLVAGGKHPTGGYRLTMTPDSPRLRGKTLVVEIALQPPGENAMVTQVVTRPCGIIRLPKANQGMRSVEVRFGDLRYWRSLPD